MVIITMAVDNESLMGGMNFGKKGSDLGKVCKFNCNRPVVFSAFLFFRLGQQKCKQKG